MEIFKNIILPIITAISVIFNIYLGIDKLRKDKKRDSKIDSMHSTLEKLVILNKKVENEEKDKENIKLEKDKHKNLRKIKKGR